MNRPPTPPPCTTRVRSGDPAHKGRFGPLALCVAAVLLVLGNTGCLNLEPAPDPTRYFLLHPLEGDTGSPAPQAGAAVGLAPVTVPAYLHRPWLVIRTSETEIRYSDYNRWGEPLDKGIQRVLAVNLASLLETNRVVLDAWHRQTVAAELSLAVDRFDVSEEGAVVLDARWRIQSRDESFAGHHQLRRNGPAPGNDPAGSAAAMSEALGELSQQIATDLRRSMAGAD